MDRAYGNEDVEEKILAGHKRYQGRIFVPKYPCF